MLGAMLGSIFAIRASRRAARQSTDVVRVFEVADEMRRIQERAYHEETRFHTWLPELIERIPEEVMLRVGQELINRDPAVTNITAEAFHVHQVDTRAERARLTQEIAHSLRTPLAQIEAAALSIQLQSRTEYESAAIQRIRDGVEICKCFISAYRNYGRVQEKVGHPSDNSNLGMLKSAIEFYRDASDKTLAMEIRGMPESLDSYSNDFIIAALLPLLENAVEASPEGGKISLDFARVQNFAVFTVANTFSGDTPTPRVFDRGYTTKSNHQGVGLSVSKGLIEGFAGGELGMNIENEKVSFTVSLPSAR
ncbi:HAMP domain-containing sensor histidine kinase [Streptomyces malaysiensis subsp. malaysiensis]|uniref:sensor histidine kinase n=1 Tax=Streptomyces malaysiensis TaxID=92644 RepID=UPI0024C01EDE|nr:HAMP domain-containing sensor histidine kinase [Streptomyces sp. NA07423]WHX19628.1 HAMP domain-containing sensor histidine kinase [Streptomyces sp. NA07423]